jgi:urease beta subunit
MSRAQVPGAVLYGEGDLVLNEGRVTVQLVVTNTGDRAIQVGSHFHFLEANRALRFDRRVAFGKRLDIPSGTAVRFEAGQTHAVSLIPFGGAGRILGFQGFTNGRTLEEALAAAVGAGFELEEVPR